MATTSKTGSTKPSLGATEEFFDALAKRGHEPLLHSASGTVRFDLVGGGSIEHWSVAIAKGNVSVSRRATKADALVRLDRALFERIVTGRENAMAVALRGVMVPTGDLGLVMLFQRLFPGPPSARGGSKAETGRVPPGTELGTAMIVEGIVAPMELGHLPYKEGTYENYVGRACLERDGEKKWRRHVADVVRRLIVALQPDDTVIGGGNVTKLGALPPHCRQGENANAFRGGFRLWEKGNIVPPDLPPGRARSERKT